MNKQELIEQRNRLYERRNSVVSQFEDATDDEVKQVLNNLWNDLTFKIKRVNRRLVLLETMA